MKRSHLSIAIILIASTAIGWHNHRQLVSMRARNAQLAEEVALLGTSSKTGASRERASSTRDRTREDAEALAAEFIAFASEAGKMLEAGISPDAQTAKKTADLIDRIITLNASQREAFLAQFRAAPGINEFTRRNMLMDWVTALSSKNPRAGLDLFIGSPELLNEGTITKQYIGELLGILAKNDPQGALEWIRSHKESHPDLVTDDALSFVLAGVAVNDPTLAFELLGDVEKPKHREAIAKIAEAATTPEQRSLTLAALRKFAEAQQNPQALKEGIQDLTFGDAHQKSSFEETSAWIASAQLSSEEIAFATQYIEHRVKTNERGQWLEWLGDSELPADVVRDRAYNLAAVWTEEDYQAAGQWLNSAPESPQKSAAVSAYAAKAYPHDPENAMKWVQTLPQGPDRTKALQTIYQGMPQDSDAAKTFAAEHGLAK